MLPDQLPIGAEDNLKASSTSSASVPSWGKRRSRQRRSELCHRRYSGRICRKAKARPSRTASCCGRQGRRKWPNWSSMTTGSAPSSQSRHSPPDLQIELVPVSLRFCFKKKGVQPLVGCRCRLFAQSLDIPGDDWPEPGTDNIVVVEPGDNNKFCSLAFQTLD